VKKAKTALIAAIASALAGAALAASCASRPAQAPAAEGGVLRVSVPGAGGPEGAAVPASALGLEAGGRYEISADLLVPSATRADIRLQLRACGSGAAGARCEAVFTTGVFRAHPGYHDPDFAGPEWRRYSGILDAGAGIDFARLKLVVLCAAGHDGAAGFDCAAGSDGAAAHDCAGGAPGPQAVFRVGGLSAARLVAGGERLASAELGFGGGAEPFEPLGAAELSIASAGRSVWHSIGFGRDWQDYRGLVSAGAQMAGARVGNFGRTDRSSFRMENATGLWTSGDGNFLVFRLPRPIPAGARAHVSWWVYIPALENIAADPRRAQGSGPGGSNIRGPGLVLNGAFGSPEHQPTNFRPGSGAMADLGRRTPLGQWFLTETYADVTAHVGDVSTLHFRFRVNEPHEQPALFFIDDIAVTVEIADEPYVPTWGAAMALPPMREAFEHYFALGNILEPALLGCGDTVAMFLRHFSSVTAENAMKPGPISGGMLLTRRPAALSLGGARAMVGFARERGLQMVGHTLVWHEQSSVWQYLDPATLRYLPRAQAKENMRWFIQQYAGYFEGRVDVWDVANEVVSGSADLSAASYANVFTGEGRPAHPVPEAGSWMRRIRNNVPWFNAFSHGADFAAGERGWDYIYYAYVFARRYAPSALLIYNDFADEVPGKRDAIAGMVEYFNERWHRDSANNPAYRSPGHPDYGRLLIEAIGMQAHYNHNTVMENVRAAIVRYAQTGARVHVTELDIDFRGAVAAAQGGWMTREQLAEQARRYGMLFRWYLEFSGHIDRVTFWGRDDASSWRSDAAPTLFDRALNPKPAFFAVMEAAQGHSAAPFVEPGAFRAAEAGVPFRAAVAAGGRPAPALSVSGGALPPGLRLSPSGAVYGTPSLPGLFGFEVQASSALGSARQAFSIYVAEGR